jgi:hypothetical protein
MSALTPPCVLIASALFFAAMEPILAFFWAKFRGSFPGGIFKSDNKNKESNWYMVLNPCKFSIVSFTFYTLCLKFTPRPWSSWNATDLNPANRKMHAKFFLTELSKFVEMLPRNFFPLSLCLWAYVFIVTVFRCCVKILWAIKLPKVTSRRLKEAQTTVHSKKVGLQLPKAVFWWSQAPLPRPLCFITYPTVITVHALYSVTYHYTANNKLYGGRYSLKCCVQNYIPVKNFTIFGMHNVLGCGSF